ncbi:MAG: tRNA pseudouridine(38-40) synthase TruA [Saprospiraceae bacterium]|nr:tRNA pseudouridine(38-40) synthase TruA [Saprospiraceae bacterium]
MRYFICLSYHGGPFVGWQVQPKGRSVQGCIEEALSKILRLPIGIVGCGRTDAGVHARKFFAHFDSERSIPADTALRLNKMLHPHIAIQAILPVDTSLHARFSAIKRSYKYHICRHFTPFQHTLEYHYYGFAQLDKDLMQQAAQLLLEFDDFYPFCKSRSDANHYRCQLLQSHWHFDTDRMVYEVSSNRFLRGMVRLIVGMCIQVGSGQCKLNEVRQAMQTHEMLTRRLSAPAHGLFLTDIVYDPPLEYDLGG